MSVKGGLPTPPPPRRGRPHFGGISPPSEADSTSVAYPPPLEADPTVDRITDASENITFSKNINTTSNLTKKSRLPIQIYVKSNTLFPYAVE